MQPSMLADTLVKIFYLPVYVCLSRRLHYKKKKEEKKRLNQTHLSHSESRI